MELRIVLRALLRSWPAVIVCALLGVGTAWAVTAFTKPVYQARTQLFVAAQSGGADIAQLQQGNAFSQARVQSYASIVASRQVTEGVVGMLQLDTTPEELAARITAEAPLNTVLVNVAVSDTDPTRAARIANAVALRFSEVVERLETPRGDPARTRSPVKIGVTETAIPPSAPLSPRPTLNTAMGLLVGLFIGGAIAVLRETLDTTMKTTEALAKHTGLPVLGAIPYDKKSAGLPPTEGALGHSPRAEAFRHLRTNLKFTQIDQASSVIVVTSALPGEGKTSAAVGLALSLAESGTPTCLVDADLRRPRIAAAFGLVQDAGLASVLINQADIDDVTQQTGRLSVLTSGPIPPNPAELLASGRMREVLDELAGRYKAVVVDSAPLLPVADTVGLAPMAQGAILVAQAGKTPRDRTVAAAESLRKVGVHTLGAVLSMVPVPSRVGGGYGALYGYGDPAVDTELPATPPRPRDSEPRARGPEPRAGVSAQRGMPRLIKRRKAASARGES
ncbi:polysaccharide biosynthesis tyrosine autokinase [Streptomyces sp. SCSIO 30461]|uniref:polysaccharide biosynthesis tyrosine autokinase n=1 Tax=Streptomyces sp. SCSIO 30461 TaxID=3118085 RepID=UPI0030CAEA7D